MTKFTARTVFIRGLTCGGNGCRKCNKGNTGLTLPFLTKVCICAWNMHVDVYLIKMGNGKVKKLRSGFPAKFYGWKFLFQFIISKIHRKYKIALIK